MAGNVTVNKKKEKKSDFVSYVGLLTLKVKIYFTYCLKRKIAF